MKTFVVLATLLAVALAVPQGLNHFSPQQRGGGRTLGHPWGPRAFGPGLNNPYAFPPNPYHMRLLQQMTNAIPGSRIFVDVNGKAKLTDRFGQDIEDHHHPFGWGDFGDLLEH